MCDFIAVCPRLYARSSFSYVGLDDILIVLVLVMLVGFVAITFPQGRPRAGPRRRSWRAKVLRNSAWHGETHRDYAPSRASNTEQCGFASQVTFPAEMGLVKVSMLPRAPDHPARARPPLRRLRRHDRDRIRLSALCFSQPVFYYTDSCFNILFDLCILIIPTLLSHSTSISAYLGGQLMR
ncbi:hypothetical protein VUR80DRAFT_7330 [Thermomyces stellatus]